MEPIITNVGYLKNDIPTLLKVIDQTMIKYIEQYNNDQLADADKVKNGNCYRLSALFNTSIELYPVDYSRPYKNMIASFKYPCKLSTMDTFANFVIDINVFIDALNEWKIEWILDAKWIPDANGLTIMESFNKLVEDLKFKDLPARYTKTIEAAMHS